MSRDDPEAALSWIERARPMADATTNHDLRRLARGDPRTRRSPSEPALEIYLDLIGDNRADAAMALDACAHHD